MLLTGWVLAAGLAWAGDVFIEDAEGASAASTGQALSIGGIPDAIWQVAEAQRHRPLVERMQAVSGALLGRPYTADPLGEGQGPDADPLVRYDTFDCLTYVEEVLALSMAGDITDVARIRNGLRYGPEPVSYVARNHFMEFQWIPDAIAGGWLRDSTGDYGTTQVLEREFSLQQWNNWAGRTQFHHTDQELPTGTLRLQVLPLEQARAIAAQIRPGSIVLTVREDRSWKPLWISHLGLVFHDNGTPIHRHATKMGSGGTVDHTLDWYLEHIGTYSNWPTLGIAILEPLEAGPRISRLPTHEGSVPSAPKAPPAEVAPPPLPHGPGAPDTP